MKSINPRLILYLLLGSLILFACTFVSLSNSPLSENFLSSAIEIFITVLIIDRLLNLDKSKKFQKINEPIAENLKVITSLSLFQLMNKLGSEEMTLTALENLTSEKVKTAVRLLEKSDYFKVSGAKFASEKGFTEDVYKHLLGTVKAINKVLDTVKPYPDPELLNIMSDIQVILITATKLEEERIKMFSHLEKIKEDKQLYDALSVAWYDPYENSRFIGVDLKNAQSVIRKFNQTMIEIYKRADEKNLFFDI